MVNKEYCREIAKFFLPAETLANNTVHRGAYRTHEEWCDAWNRVFHAEMNRLTSEAGIRNALVVTPLLGI